MARDFDATLYRNAMYAHAELAKVFDVPVVMTTSAEVGESTLPRLRPLPPFSQSPGASVLTSLPPPGTGPNGPLPGEFLEWFPDAPLIQRPGQVNAWDNEDFRKAIEATGKKQIVMAGITTDVCTTFCALSMREAGYSVFLNVEASGTTTELIRDVSNDRMRDAGVQVLSLFAIMCELMRDWRNTPGATELFPYLDKYYPAYSMIARAHKGAIDNGTIVPGEVLLP